MNKQSHYKTTPSLEYAAILSGLSMVGDDISAIDIEVARAAHFKAQKKSNFSSLLTSTKHLG